MNQHHNEHERRVGDEVIKPEDATFDVAAYRKEYIATVTSDSTEDTLRAMTACLEAYPEDCNMLIRRARVYINEGNFTEAKNDLDAAIALGSDAAKLHLKTIEHAI